MERGALIIGRNARIGSGLAIVALVSGLVAGCARAQPKDTTASTTTESSAVASSSPAASSASSSASATPTETRPASFNGRCEDLLPLTLVMQALQRPVVGRTASIVGIAEPNIGRLAYLNCQYGIVTKTVAKKPVTTTKVEIGVSLYETSDQANKRVQATVDDYLSQGATNHPIAVGPYSAQILLGVGNPTLVVAAGPRTTAVSVVASVFGGPLAKPMSDLAAAVLDATSHFDQGGPVMSNGVPVSSASGSDTASSDAASSDATSSDASASPGAS